MAKIVVSGPCQRIHRFLLPPHSKHVVSHSLSGGAIVLAGILRYLLCGDRRRENSDHCNAWEEQLREWERDNRAGQFGAGMNSLPDRYIRLAPFAPAPTARKHLKPDIEYLRIEQKEDGDGLYDEVQVPLSFEDREGKRHMFIVGGKKPDKPWKLIANDLMHLKSCGMPVGSDLAPIVYILAKSHRSLVDHARKARKEFKGLHVKIVGQIDVAHLSCVFPIRTETAYERTIGDLCRVKVPGRKKKSGEGKFEPLPLFDSLLIEEKIDHLVVRIGNAACLVASRSEESDDTPILKLMCHPDRCAPTTFPGLGTMLAYDMLLCSSICYYLSRCNEGGIDQSLDKGAMVGVQATYRCFIDGFGSFRRDKNGDKLTKAQMEVDPVKLFTRFIESAIAVEDGKEAEGEDSVLSEMKDKTREFKVHYETALSSNKFWRMVVPEESGSGEESCLMKARAYLLKNETKENGLPLVKLGKLDLVDRLEVEDYLFLQRLLLDYQDRRTSRPLSIGVFGQPGAGKSFGVKQLISEMSGSSGAFAKDGIELNLSQLRSLDELVDCFHQVRDACLQQPIPLVFFDEFDSGFEGQAFGWLKYFLAPMQDGKFLSKGRSYSFGRSVFVFAGGVNHSFAEFNERSRNPSFCDAKGPDFISRLRGILNITGVNKPEGEAPEHIFMVRRAVFLRFLLEERLGRAEKNLIDSDMADAFLKVARFKHGARSMEAILDMSNFRRGQPFTLSNLPPRDQLDMHVDAREFLRLAGVMTSMSKP